MSRPKQLPYIHVNNMYNERGYTCEDSFVSDDEVERVINVLLDEVNELNQRVYELESK